MPVPPGHLPEGTCGHRHLLLPDGLILPRGTIPVTLTTGGDVRKQDYGLSVLRAGGVCGVTLDHSTGFP